MHTLVVQVPKWLAVKDMPTSLSLELLHAALQCQPDMIKQAPQLLQVRMRNASLVSCITFPRLCRAACARCYSP